MAGRVSVRVGDAILAVDVSECTYPPLEDSLLAIRLLEGLRGRYERVLDLCTGSGVLALAAHTLFKPSLLAATDISPYAVSDARRNLPSTAIVVRCDCAECLRRGRIWDLVIANPPYLASAEYDVGDGCDWYSGASWSAGRVLESACREAVSRGREVVLVYSSLSPFDVVSCLENSGFAITRVLEERFFMETIYAVHAVWSVDGIGEA